MIVTHVREVGKSEQVQTRSSARDQGRVELQFVVLGMGVLQILLQNQSVRSFRKEHFSEAERPPSINEINQPAPGVATRIGRIVIRTGLDYGPVHELHVAIAGD